MNIIIALLKSLFESKYTPFTLQKSVVIKKEKTKMVEDKVWSGGNGISDPMDVKIVGTGEFYDVLKETWVCFHKKTNLPKYKHVYVSPY